jgi:hypothetical protein
LCQCADCRRERGEDIGPWDEHNFDEDAFLDEGGEFDEPEKDSFFGLENDELRRMFDENLPKGTPPETANFLFEAMKRSFSTGESPEEALSQVLDKFGSGSKGGGKKKKKARRKT